METKPQEYRVGLTPTGARALLEAGHEALIERGAGIRAGFPDDAYADAGARLCDTPKDVVARADLLVKVKELLPPELALLRPGFILFAYLHLPNDAAGTKALLDSRTNAIAYENVRLPDGSLPLLIPMSRVAGRMAGDIAAQYLKKPGPGRGKLLGGIQGVAPARAVVVGSGHVGAEAADVLSALGAQVTVTARDPGKLAALEASLEGRIATRIINPDVLRELLAGADILIGAVWSPDGFAPKLVSRDMVRSMGEGAVIVEVGIDQGGVCETSHPTTHAEPTYVDEGVIHYCVPNMPGAVPRTSTEALTNATLPYILKLANKGLASLRDDPALAAGACTINGHLTNESVANTHGLPYTPLSEVL